MSILELHGVGKSYSRGHATTVVLKDIDLSIDEGEFVAIVGFSGSGKTTLISMLAGLLQPDTGSVRMRGKDVNGPSLDRGVVFQSYSLFPWLTVSGNVGLAVDARSPELSAEKRAAEVNRYVSMVHLSHAAERRPSELSGGMRQRVALARALATHPEILLLDEPLSALDALTRANMQDQLEEIRHRERRTIVLVTNDVDEALLLADRIIPLTPGPGATLGPEFRVCIPRPRDRRAINHDAEYRHLRAEITQYLLDLAATRALPADETRQAPAAVPNTQRAVHDSRRPITTIDAHERMKAASVPGAVREAGHVGTAANLEKFVELFHVTKVYPTPKGPLTVVDNLDLDIRKGECISLIGHSGCGKSTVLSMVAGLTDVTTGGIVLDGKEVVAAGPDRGVVFQAPNLLPWLSARDNVAVGVDRVYPHEPAAARRDITEYYLERVGLADALDRKPGELSNGMKQRVGLARAFALSPKLLLLDEPFGMLDALTRWELQELLMEIRKRTEVTAICVTHDIDEAILLADRVVMMTNGPHAHIGRIMKVELPRPRTRKMLLDHARYYEYREELLSFLEEHEQQRTSRAA
jgi:nitrate/nitrite transport system ATP-binding protein